MKKPKYKVGDVVIGRIIMEVITCVDDGKESIHYAYRYPNEPEDIKPMYCAESTIVRKTYR
jgi:hypothetical protein